MVRLLGFVLVIALLELHKVKAEKSSCVLLKDGRNIMARCTFMALKDIRDIETELPTDLTTGMDLSHNQLKTIHSHSLSLYPYLTNLGFSHNEITHIDRKTFSSLYWLKDVDLSNNKLKFINPELISDNSNLLALSLAGNPLVHFRNNSSVIISSSLQHLDLNNCGLTSIYPATFSRIPKLTHLYLNNNYLQKIYPPTLQGTKKLIHVELFNNRWNCNCNIVDTILWGYQKDVFINIDDPIMCSKGDYHKVLWTKEEPYTSCRETLEGNANISNEVLSPDDSLNSPEFLQITPDVHSHIYKPMLPESSETHSVSNILYSKLPNNYDKISLPDDVESSEGYIDLNVNNFSVTSQGILPVPSGTEKLFNASDYLNSYPVSGVNISLYQPQSLYLYLLHYNGKEGDVQEPSNGLTSNDNSISNFPEFPGMYLLPNYDEQFPYVVDTLYSYDEYETHEFLNSAKTYLVPEVDKLPDLQSSMVMTNNIDDKTYDRAQSNDFDKHLEYDAQSSNLNKDFKSEAEYDFQNFSIGVEDIERGFSKLTNTSLVLDKKELLDLLKNYDPRPYYDTDEVPDLPENSSKNFPDEDTSHFTQSPNIYVIPGDNDYYDYDYDGGDYYDDTVSDPLSDGDKENYIDRDGHTTFHPVPENETENDVPNSSGDFQIFDDNDSESHELHRFPVDELSHESSNTYYFTDETTVSDQQDQLVSNFSKWNYVQDDSDLDPIVYTEESDEEHEVHKNILPVNMDRTVEDRWEAFINASSYLSPKYDFSGERSRYLLIVIFTLAFVILASIAVALTLAYKFMFTRSKKYQKLFQKVDEYAFSDSDQEITNTDYEPV